MPYRVLPAAILSTILLLPDAADAAPPARTETVSSQPDATEASSERARIRSRGRRLTHTAYGLTGVSLVFTGMTFYYNSQEQYGPAVLTGSMGLALAIAAIPLAVAGGRRTKQPERYMKSRTVAVTPIVGRDHAALSFSMRF